MSRIGKKPVALVKGVSASISGQTVEVKGPKGTRSFDAGVLTVDLPRICALRIRVSISPRGSFIICCLPYQLDFTMPGI